MSFRPEPVPNPLADHLQALAAARSKPLTKKTLAWVAALSVVGGTVLGGVAGGGATYFVAQQQAPKTVVSTTATSETSLTAQAASAASESVVTIQVASARASGSGSGVVVAAGGFIVTNNHVVDLDGQGQGATLTVETSDGKLLDATVVGTDPAADLAVLKVDADLPVISFASEAPVAGEAAIAIGAPLGLSNTVTDGVISAVGRGIQLSREVTVPVLQTDAPINPGNSGGALVNERGELVGINVAIADVNVGQQQSTSGSIGIGFAIEGQMVQRVVDEIIAEGAASHALLGASISDQTDASVAVVGAVVRETVDSGPAASAGLKAGDVVTAVDGTRVTDAADLTARIRSYAAGETVAVTALRDGKEIEIEVELGSMS